MHSDPCLERRYEKGMQGLATLAMLTTLAAASPNGNIAGLVMIAESGNRRAPSDGFDTG